MVGFSTDALNKPLGFSQRLVFVGNITLKHPEATSNLPKKKTVPSSSGVWQSGTTRALNTRHAHDVADSTNLHERVTAVIYCTVIASIALDSRNIRHTQSTGSAHPSAAARTAY